MQTGDKVLINSVGGALKGVKGEIIREKEYKETEYYEVRFWEDQEASFVAEELEPQETIKEVDDVGSSTI